MKLYKNKYQPGGKRKLTILELTTPELINQYNKEQAILNGTYIPSPTLPNDKWTYQHPVTVSKQSPVVVPNYPIKQDNITVVRPIVNTKAVESVKQNIFNTGPETAYIPVNFVGKPTTYISPEQQYQGTITSHVERPWWDTTVSERQATGLTPLMNKLINTAMIVDGGYMLKNGVKYLGKKALPSLIKTSDYLLANTPIKYTYKLNPFANRLSQYNRVVGEDAIIDLQRSGLVRTGKGTKQVIPFGDKVVISYRPSAYPSFSKGNPKNIYINQVLESGHIPYIISTNRPMKISTLGRHGKGSTYLPVDKSGNYLTSFSADNVNVFEINPHWLKGYKKVKIPNDLPTFNNIKENSFINLKGMLQQYPKGPLTQSEIDIVRNSPEYLKLAEESKRLQQTYGLANPHQFNSLENAILQNNRHIINPIVYNGRNWDAANYFMATVGVTAYPILAGLYGLASSPPAIKNRGLSHMGVPMPASMSKKDTIIDLSNALMDYAKINEYKPNTQIILGGEFVESANNSVRPAKDWLTATDTYSDKKYPSKDIESFYGVEDGKFKVGKAKEFKPNTEIVPRRFGVKKISQAVLNGNEMRLLDKDGNIIYHNTPNTGKFILYSPSTNKSKFIYINKGATGVNLVNKFLEENKDAEYIHLDNGRYEYYTIPVYKGSPLSREDFQSYYNQDLGRKGTPGYNLLIK